jgi:molybdate transport system substrate-binding protein
MHRPSGLLAVPFAALGLLAAACGSSGGSSSGTTAAPATQAPATQAPASTAAVPATTSAAPATNGAATPVSGNITVFAATSLTDSFEKIGDAFTNANPGAKVTFSFDASSALAAQIMQGAPADVFASADTTNMDKITKPGLNGTSPEIFATNLLAVIVPKGNPKGITGVQDLSKPDLKVVLCDPSVPCGKYANQILTSANVTVKPVSLAQNVKGVVTPVTTGEADAGIVYVTDVLAAGDKAQAVDIPENINVVANYPIASINASKSPDVDKAFINFVLGDDGQAILKKYGFLPPPS